MASPTSNLLYATSPTSTTSCATITPGLHGYVPPEACNAQWAYGPSFSAAVAFAVLFGTLTLAHLCLAIAFRKSFCWVIIMGTAWETAAFIMRSLGARNQQNSTYAIASQLLFLLAPLWMNAFVYMVAGRLIWTYHPEKKVWCFKAIRLGMLFVTLDILSFFAQAAGGLMLSPGNEESIMELGKTIYMVGVGVQLFFIVVFIALIGKFLRDTIQAERFGTLPTNGVAERRPLWKLLTYALYAVLVLITIRIIFRLTEFSRGADPNVNKLLYEEGYALGLDAFPMVLASFVLAVMHPGLVLKGQGSEFPSRKERKAEGKDKKTARNIEEARNYEFELELERGSRNMDSSSNEGLLLG